METANALLDFHWVPGQIEIYQPMTKLKISAFGAAVSQKQRASLPAKFLRDRLPMDGGSLAVDDRGGNTGRGQAFSQSGLSAQKLGENDDSAFRLREREKQLAFPGPTRFRRRLLPPDRNRLGIRKGLQSVAPGSRAAPGSLQEKPSPKA